MPEIGLACRGTAVPPTGEAAYRRVKTMVEAVGSYEERGDGLDEAALADLSTAVWELAAAVDRMSFEGEG